MPAKCSLIERRCIGKVLTEQQKHSKGKVDPYMPLEFSVACYRFGHSHDPRPLRLQSQLGVKRMDRKCLFVADQRNALNSSSSSLPAIKNNRKTVRSYRREGRCPTTGSSSGTASWSSLPKGRLASPVRSTPTSPRRSPISSTKATTGPKSGHRAPEAPRAPQPPPRLPPRFRPVRPSPQRWASPPLPRMSSSKETGPCASPRTGRLPGAHAALVLRPQGSRGPRQRQQPGRGRQPPYWRDHHRRLFGDPEF